MTRYIFEVRFYIIMLSRKIEASFGDVVSYSYAVISCLDAENRYKLNIYFLRPDSPTIKNVNFPDKGRATIFLPAEQYSSYVDLLRNEKPVYAYITNDNPEMNLLCTTEEPVGVGENTLKE